MAFEGFVVELRGLEPQDSVRETAFTCSYRTLRFISVALVTCGFRRRVDAVNTALETQ